MHLTIRSCITNCILHRGVRLHVSEKVMKSLDSFLTYLSLLRLSLPTPSPLFFSFYRPLPSQIWDIAGQDYARTMASTYYRGASGVAIMFDLTEKKTIEKTKYGRQSQIS